MNAAGQGMLAEPASDKKPPKHVDTVIMKRRRPTAEKPYHHVEITHHHTHPAHPPEHHTVKIHGSGASTGLDQLHDHMEDHMGQPNPGEAEADAGPEGGEAV